jgi:glutathione S-transferase
MKLYSRPLSPYSARARVALYTKGLEFETMTPEMGWAKDPAFLEVNPVGRIPVLVLDDGTKLIESGPIVEYLEEAFPEPPMLPRDRVERARVRALTLLVEHDVLGTLMPLFMLFDKKRRGLLDKEGRDANAIEEATAKLHRALGHVEAALPSKGLAQGEEVTTADAILLPVRFNLDSLVTFARMPALLDAYPRVVRYRETAQRAPALARVWEEMVEGLKVFTAYLESVAPSAAS